MSSLVCPNCKNQANADELFCSKCGTKLEPAESISFYCKGCGRILHNGDCFCGSCGRSTQDARTWRKKDYSGWGCLLIIIIFIIGFIWGYCTLVVVDKGRADNVRPNSFYNSVTYLA